MASVITGWTFEDSGAVLMARATGWANTPVTRATLSAITYRVTDLRGVVGDQLPERTRLAMGAR